MYIKDNILKSEMEFPKIFTSYIEKDYGILFYNENNKESHDSNHAVLYTEKISDIEYVLFQIKDFYLSKSITPRIYHPFKSGYLENHKTVFEKFGYEFRIYGNNRLMLLTQNNNIITNKTLKIKQITKWDERIATDILMPNGEEYEVDVAKNSLKYKSNYLFVGYLDDVAVTTAYFHVSEYGCTRYDYIITAKNFRNKGYAREILSHIVDYCKENNIPNCFQYPANETSAKMCYEAGFRVKFELECGEAFYTLK